MPSFPQHRNLKREAEDVKPEVDAKKREPEERYTNETIFCK